MGPPVHAFARIVREAPHGQIGGVDESVLRGRFALAGARGRALVVAPAMARIPPLAFPASPI
jgi:hypothetical protein